MVAANGTVTASESALEVIEGHEASASEMLARIVGELTELRDSEQRLVDELTRRAGEARTRCAGYDKAIGALGAKDKRGPATPVPPKPAAKAHVSDALRAEVLGALAGGPMTITQIAELAGCHASTVSGALGVLRAEQRVRKAGRDQSSTAPRKPGLYALMPEGDSGD